jgi:tRNA modification GTPase
VRLVDTAGLRESQDEIEQEGVRRSKLWMEKADLILHLVDSTNPLPVEIEGDAPLWVVSTKSDLLLRDVSHETSRIKGGDDVNTTFTISVKSGEGCLDLRDALKAYLKSFIGGEGALITRERHLSLIKIVETHFQNALQLDYNRDGDRVAEELRLALTAIGKITGHVGVEDMLDKLFREFCIGK